MLQRLGLLLELCARYGFRFTQQDMVDLDGGPYSLRILNKDSLLHT